MGFLCFFYNSSWITLTVPWAINVSRRICDWTLSLLVNKRLGYRCVSQWQLAARSSSHLFFFQEKILLRTGHHQITLKLCTVRKARSNESIVNTSFQSCWLAAKIKSVCNVWTWSLTKHNAIKLHELKPSSIFFTIHKYQEK